MEAIILRYYRNSPICRVYIVDLYEMPEFFQIRKDLLDSLRGHNSVTQYKCLSAEVQNGILEKAVVCAMREKTLI